MDSNEQELISTKCINGHKFKVPKEKIQASSSGKSFVTLCPKCNKVARLRKEEVFKLFGVNPRDHVAVGNLFASLSNQSPQATGTTIPTNGATLQDAISSSTTHATQSTDDDVDEDSDDDTEDDTEDDEEDDDTEYTAQVETADDVTGKQKKVRRFRVVSDDDESESDEEDSEEDYSRTPISPRSPPKNKKQAKKVRPRARNVEPEEELEEDDEEDYREDRRARKTARRPIEEDEPVDPNDILKDVIDESGIDETSRDHIFDYIDLQPDGWQPSAIQGVIEMYVSPAASRKISQRYQAELYREQKRREREQRLLNMMGAPAGNIRFDDNRGMGIPPFNTPLNRGTPPIGAPYPGGQPFQQRGDPYDTRVDPYGSQDQRFDPRAMAPMPIQRREMSPIQVKQMISEELETRFEKLQNAITQTKREDALQSELSQMRALVFDVLKQRTSDPNAGSQKSDPLIASLLANQSELNKTLLTHTITKVDKEDPMQKILLQELLNLKNQKGAPSLAHSSEELTQRIQLQKLANELELAQADFRDKAEGRAFARDLAGQALTKIGESFATAYLESQRMSAMQAASMPTGGQTPQQNAIVEPTVAVPAETALVSEQRSTTGAQQRGAEPTSTEIEPEKYHVKGVPRDDGLLTIPCPTCGSDMVAKPGDTRVSCGTCGSVFNAGAPPQRGSSTDRSESEQETPPMGESQETLPVEESHDEPPRTPKVIL